LAASCIAGAASFVATHYPDQWSDMLPLAGEDAMDIADRLASASSALRVDQVHFHTDTAEHAVQVRHQVTGEVRFVSFDSTETERMRDQILRRTADLMRYLPVPGSALHAQPATASNTLFRWRNAFAIGSQRLCELLTTRELTLREMTALEHDPVRHEYTLSAFVDGEDRLFQVVIHLSEELGELIGIDVIPREQQ
jgi:hypothetical protein